MLKEGYEIFIIVLFTGRETISSQREAWEKFIIHEKKPKVLLIFKIREKAFVRGIFFWVTHGRMKAESCHFNVVVKVVCVWGSTSCLHKIYLNHFFESFKSLSNSLRESFNPSLTIKNFSKFFLSAVLCTFLSPQ